MPAAQVADTAKTLVAPGTTVTLPRPPASLAANSAHVMDFERLVQWLVSKGVLVVLEGEMEVRPSLFSSQDCYSDMICLCQDLPSPLVTDEVSVVPTAIAHGQVSTHSGRPVRQTACMSCGPKAPPRCLQAVTTHASSSQIPAEDYTRVGQQ
jgi:hypothetical protein